MSTAADDVGTYLLSKMPDLVDGLSLKVGDGVSVPRAGQSAFCVYVTNTQGMPSEAFVDGDAGNRDDFFGIMVRVRGDKNDRRTAEVAAIRIFDLLSFSRFGRISNLQVTGTPNSLGVDAEGFPWFSINAIGQMCSLGAAMPRIYFGASPSSGGPTHDAAWAKSLGSSIASSSRLAVFTTPALGGGDALFVVIPTAYGVPSFRRADALSVLAHAVDASFDVDGVACAAYKITASPISSAIVRIQ